MPESFFCWCARVVGKLVIKYDHLSYQPKPQNIKKASGRLFSLEYSLSRGSIWRFASSFYLKW